ncbi:MAG TPA: phosphoribosyltransferase family protein [Flavisolibacter sp.]|nr:phosphoribosyltransferase family protein [Flavisolibacter sp.]
MKTSFPLNPIQSLKSRFSILSESILHLAFPHICEGCGTDTVAMGHFLCLECKSKLPETHFTNLPNNPVEKIFWGRLPVEAATATYYFTKDSTLQQLLHQFKYRNHQRLGAYLGRILGNTLANSPRFQDVDALIPLPLFSEKEHHRGYNQALILCEGISEVWQRPIIKDAVMRISPTESQTKKNRVERWQNMENQFQLKDPSAVTGKHLLLVDDVVTTGATLEACGRAILQGEHTRVSITTLCISTS